MAFAFRTFSVFICAISLQAQVHRPFVIDMRLEHLRLICDLSEPISPRGRDLSPFHSLLNHEALRLAKALPPSFRDSTSFLEWILQYGPPPEFKPQSSIPQKIQSIFPTHDEAAFLNALRDFAPLAEPLLAREDMRNEIHRAQVDAYNLAVLPGLVEIERISGISEASRIGAGLLEGIPPGGSVTFRLSSNNLASVYMVLFPLETDKSKQIGMRNRIVSRFLEKKAEVILEDACLPPIPEEPGRRWLVELQRVNKGDASTWETHVRRSLAWALSIRVAEALGDVDRSRNLSKNAEGRLPWVPRLVVLWKELDTSNRATTLQSALPELMHVFSDEDPVITTRRRMIGMQPKGHLRPRNPD